MSQDAPPPISQDLSIRADRLRLLGRKVLIEADTRQDTKIGSLWVPTMRDQPYPTAGWIIAKGPEVTEFEVGDFVLIEEEGQAVGTTYYDLFEIVLKHEDGFVETIWAEVETEPVVRERVNAFRRGGEDLIINVMDKKAGESISFNCSNVVDFQIGDMSNPSVNLTYIPMFMVILMNEDEMPSLYYFTEPEKILATVSY